MSTVQTINGPIDSSELGRTLSHEHFTAGAAGMERLPWVFDLDDAVTANIEALKRVKQVGIASLIDLTPFDLGRQPALFQRVAAANTGVNVVCATGVYRWVPAYLMGREPDDVAEHCSREIRDGIEGTGLTPGIIKLAWDMEYRLNDGPPRLHAARATSRRPPAPRRARRRRSGCRSPATRCAADELGTPLMDIFEDEGLDPRAVTIGHSNDTQDPTTSWASCSAAATWGSTASAPCAARRRWRGARSSRSG